MIREGFKYFIERERLTIVPCSFTIPSGANISLDVKQMLATDIGCRGESIFDNQRNIIRETSRSSLYYPLDSLLPNSVIIMIGGEEINPAYGIVTSSNRIDFYTNLTNNHGNGDKINVYAGDSLTFLKTVTVISSQQSFLTIDSPLNNDYIGSVVKLVNVEGAPIGYYPFRVYDISLYDNDSFTPIVEYYTPNV